MPSNDVIPISRPHFTGTEEKYLLDALRSGWISSIGKYIQAFEEKFATFCGVKHALAISNGTTALHLALVTAGIGAGDEVIVPDVTFVATANAVAYTGAKPVMVDISPDTLCICPEAIKAAITPKTRAIIPVHLYGHPADMDEINSIAKTHGLLVIEDAAEAHGAEYKGQRVGSFGNAAVFSFYGNKIVTTGEGGMITTDDPEFHAKARFLRDQAMSKEKRYWHDAIGFNYRMTNLQAAIGLAQMESIDVMLERRRQIFAQYCNAIETSDNVRLNHTANYARNVYWMICLEDDAFDDHTRSVFMQRLRENGIDTRPYFYPMTQMPMYKTTTPPVAARKSAIGINLPTYHDISPEEIERVAKAVNRELRAI